MENSYLGRDDTNNIDELTVKAALKWFVTDSSTVDFQYIHADIDNGYDAFTLDNSWVSRSDMPGKDTQLTDAFSLKYTNQINSSMHLIAILSHSNSDLEYSYNETTAWTFGVYYKDYSENLNRTHFGDYGKGPFHDVTDSQYDTTNKAIYGQIDSDLTDKLVFTLGLRAGNWEVDYSDSNGFVENNDENLYGGKVGLSYSANETDLYYVTLSRGYKPGGVNADNTLPDEDRVFETETLWNLDAGVNSKYLNNTLVNRLNFFYGKRKDQQVKTYIEQEKSFSNYFDNVARGTYYGLESELDYYPNDAWHLYTKLGLLHAEFDEYTLEMTGRAPAQSPKYQYNVGFDYSFLENWRFKANVEGMGSYYFSNTHNQKSDPYALLNSSLEYMYGDFGVTLWGRNLTDKEYNVRGFYFGNDPSKYYEAELYTQKGTTRTFGLTLTYDF